MRILHTSDWHIGRTFHGHSTLEALRGVLEALTDQVRALDVDVVIVAGDVFDTATPSAAAYTLLTDALVGLVDAGAQVVVTSGNHDSAARLGFQSRLLRDGIHVVTDPLTVGTPVLIDDEHSATSGPVAFYPIPFLEPVLVRSVFPGVELRSQADALGHAMSLVRADLAARGGRSVAIAHCFAVAPAGDGATDAGGPAPEDTVTATAGLERVIQQGGLEFVPADVFDGPDYIALGHIHGRKRLSERVRYAGAPLHYSFGERSRERGGWLVEIDGDGLSEVSWVSLPVPRRLVTITATFDELLSDAAFEAHVEDWVSARYTDDLAVPDPMRRLQERFPHCALVQHAPAERSEAEASTYARRVADAVDHVALIDQFLRHVRAGVGAAERELEIIRDVVGEHAAAKASV